MGIDSGSSYENWSKWNKAPPPNRASREIKWKEECEPYTKRGLIKYLNDALSEYYYERKGTLRIEEKINGKREEMPLLQGFEEIILNFHDGGAVMKWRGDDYLFNTANPLRINRNSTIGILTDTKSGKEGFFVRNICKKQGRIVETTHVFTC